MLNIKRLLIICVVVSVLMQIIVSSPQQLSASKAYAAAQTQPQAQLGDDDETLKQLFWETMDESRRKVFNGTPRVALIKRYATSAVLWIVVSNPDVLIPAIAVMAAKSANGWKFLYPNEDGYSEQVAASADALIPPSVREDILLHMGEYGQNASTPMSTVPMQVNADPYDAGVYPFSGSRKVTQDPQNTESGCSHCPGSGDAWAWDFGNNGTSGWEVRASKDGKIAHIRTNVTANTGSLSQTVNNVNAIVIDHGDGYASLYLHLDFESPLRFKLGDTVLKSQPIARADHTGKSSAPHLHFAMQTWDSSWNGTGIWYKNSIASLFYSETTSKPAYPNWYESSTPSLPTPNNPNPPPTSTPPPSTGSQVKLFRNNGYNDQVWAGGTGINSDPSGNARSMDIPSGWSVKTWRQDNRGGEERCWTASVSNLEDHGWQNAIQSIQVFDHNACPAPVVSSPGQQVKLFRNNGYSDPNGNARSMEIPSGWSARTWRGDSQQGEVRCWSQSVNNLEDHGWHNAIQSIEVFNTNVCASSPGNGGVTDVTLCTSDDGNFGCRSFPEGVYANLSDFGLNDQMRSIKVPSGKSAFVFRESDLRGTGECYSGDRKPLPIGDPWDLRGQVTALQVFNQSNCPTSSLKTVVLYESNFGGHQWGTGIFPGLVNFSGEYFNDRAESLRIPNGWSARVYEHHSREGQASNCLSGEVHDLGGLNNRVSSIEVFNALNCPNIVPAQPANLQVSSTTENSISISWQDKSYNENGFRIYRWNGTEFGLYASVGANVTTFTDEGRPCNHSDYYVVSAFNATGETQASGWALGTTSVCSPPVAPSNLTANAAGCAGVQLAWTDNASNEEGYRVYRDGVDWAWLSANTAGFTDNAVSGNQQYTYEVRAYRGNVESGSSNASVVTMPDCDTTPPNAAFSQPADTKSINANLVNLALSATDDRSGIHEAQFYAGYNDGVQWNWHYIGNDVNAADGWSVPWDTSAIGDQKVALWAYVWDGASNTGIAVLYDVVLDRTAPSSTINALPAISPANFELSWAGTDATSGINSYDVQTRMNGGNWFDLQVDTSYVSARFIGVAGRIYEFRVRARDKAGNVEGWPAAPDAQTVIEADPSVSGTRFVSMLGTDNANVCTNVASPCRTIQRAVTVAQAGDEVRVAQGTYSGQMDTDVGPATVLINKAIALLGGYNANFTQRNPAANITTIDGQQKPGSVIVVLGPSARVDGFTIINGCAEQGAGVWVGNWEQNMPFVTISNNVIEGNRTVETADNWGNGAGVFVVGNVSALIQSNRISGNVNEDSDGSGAGIAVHWGAIAVINGNQVLSNSATQNTSGGINVYSATATIVNNLVQGNRNIGVDAFDAPSVTIQGNTIVSNSSSYEGGGIRIGGQTAYTITQNLISGNSADGYYGGGIHVSDGPSGVIERNVIQNNRAAGSGGGVAICGTGGQTVFTITQNTISGNSANATDGGGIFVCDGPRGMIERNVIQNNRAATSGGGVAIYDAGGLITLLNNDIIANTSGWGGGLAVVRSAAAVEIAANNILRNRTTEGDYQSGILISDVTAPVKLVNNVIAGNNNRGIKAVNTPDVQFINNTIVSNGAIGVEVLGWPEAPVNPLNAALTNNIIAGHTECGITGFNNAAINATTNVLWNTASGGSEICSEIIRSTGVFASDPKFVNAAAGDYHLQSGSPAMNAGTNAGAPMIDKDGMPRPSGGRVDIGAYEISGWRIYVPLVRRGR